MSFSARAEAAPGGLARTLDLGWLAGARLAAAAAGFGAAALLARLLGPADYGRWAMLLALQGHLLILAEMGLRQVATADCGHDARTARALLPRYLALRLVLAMLLWSLAWPTVRAFDPEGGLAAALVLAALPASALLFDWIPLARGHTAEATLPLLLRPLLLAAGLAGLALAGHRASPETAAALFAGAWVIAALASLPGLRLLPRATAAPPPSLRALLRRALPLGLSGLAAQALLGLDILLVGLVVGPVEAGRYQLASACLVAGLVVANAGGQLTLARAGALRGRREQRARFCREALLRALAIGGGLAAAGGVVAPSLLPLLFGDSYAPAVPLLWWLLPWFVLQHPVSWLQGAFAALGRERVVLRANLSALAVLLPMLAVAVWSADPRLFALARTMAEAARCLSLVRALFPRRTPAGAAPLTAGRGATCP